ncbi:MAG: benzoyl-CoA reductase, bzd-type, subunit N [Dehalococcoidia bacterium]
MGEFQELSANRHQYARDWKARTGGKVLGYFCTYVPEELVYAAGVLPVRILGSHEPQDVTERHIYGMYCPFCRDCLAQGLLGRYEYVDGVAMANTCIHIRQAFESWHIHVTQAYGYHINMPAKVHSPFAKTFLTGELGHFKRSLEDWTGKEITDQALDEAIEVYNTNRRLLHRIYESRKEDNPAIGGAEAMEMVITSQFTDKREHNRLLEEALAGLPQRPRDGEGGIRLILVGSEDDDTEMLRLTESMGATVVVDDHCTGTRYFWNEVLPQQDRLGALADRYLSKPPCPEKDLEKRLRWPHILQLARDYRVQGALMIQQKFCDPHEFDIPPLMDLFKEKLDIPSLFLEFDVTIPMGQFRTRIEAFLEMLRMEELV